MNNTELTKLVIKYRDMIAAEESRFFDRRAATLYDRIELLAELVGAIDCLKILQNESADAAIDYVIDAIGPVDEPLSREVRSSLIGMLSDYRAARIASNKIYFDLYDLQEPE